MRFVPGMRHLSGLQAVTTLEPLYTNVTGKRISFTVRPHVCRQTANRHKIFRTNIARIRVFTDIRRYVVSQVVMALERHRTNVTRIRFVPGMLS